jgi:hypothetical protein
MGHGVNDLWAFHASWRCPEVSGAVATLYFGAANLRVKCTASVRRGKAMMQPLALLRGLRTRKRTCPEVKLAR